MITCPNCDKENADESVHCGFCGHQLQEGGKKTMFGMAALDADAIKAAATAAKEAASAAAADRQSDPFAKTEMMPSIVGDPSEDTHPGGGSPLAGPPSASAPSPSFPSSGPAAPAPAPAPDPFADDFAALEQQFGNDPALDVAPPQGGSLPGLGMPPGQTSDAPGAALSGSAAPNLSSGQPFGGAQQMPSEANNPMMQAPSTAVEKKSNSTMIIALVVGGAFLFFGCIGIGVAAFLMGQ